jgi:hypothetical protein
VSRECWRAYTDESRHLKPEHGYIEQVEVDLQPRCDDGTLPANSALVAWYNYLIDATARANRPIAYQHNTKEMLQTAGFIDIREEVVRAPLNTWPTDKHQKLLGRWFNIGLIDGLEALSLAPFTRVNNWKAEEHVRPLLQDVSKEIASTRIHAYNNIHIITARRPA